MVIFLKKLDPVFDAAPDIIQENNNYYFPEKTHNDFAKSNPEMYEPNSEYYIGKPFYPGRIKKD